MKHLHLSVLLSAVLALANPGVTLGGELVASVPVGVEWQVGRPGGLVGAFSSPHSGESLTIGVDGLPPGLHAVLGEPFGDTKQIRIYGVLSSSASAKAVYVLRWTASDGRTKRVARTIVKVRAFKPIQSRELEERIRGVLAGEYDYRTPHTAAGDLGTQALPLLAHMLRDTLFRREWARIARTIGDIGDTSYFDTLRVFAHNRFQGETIGKETVQAIRSAQGALSMMATTSPRVLDYLIASASRSAWGDLPVTAHPWTPEQLAGVL